jgi:hypothetical protein
VYFRLGKLRRVSTYVQHVWGIIDHVTIEAGNTVGTDGAPPHRGLYFGRKQIFIPPPPLQESIFFLPKTA